MAKKQSVTEKRQAVLTEAAEKTSSIEGLVTELLDSFDEFISKWAVENNETIQKLHAVIGEVNEQVADLKGELEEVQSNLEEKFSGTERYQRIVDLVGELENYTDLEEPNSVENLDRNNIAEYLDTLNSLIEAASEATGTLEGIQVEG